MSDKEPKLGNITEEDIANQRKVLEAAPTKLDLVREFGEQGLIENADGSWKYELPKNDGKVSVKTLKRAAEMDQRRSRAEVAAADASKARVPMATIRDAQGNKMQVPEHHAERLDRLMFERRRHR